MDENELAEKQMEAELPTSSGNRPLSRAERDLAQWMLENGDPGARFFLPQLDLAEVTPWRCKCGCASINFQIKGHPPAPPGVHVLGDYLIGEDHMNGIFIFESGGILSGIELVGYAGQAPTVLPTLESLRHW
jgi:hypothetical protein